VCFSHKPHILPVTHHGYSEYELTREKKAYAIRGCSFRFNIALLIGTLSTQAALAELVVDGASGSPLALPRKIVPIFSIEENRQDGFSASASHSWRRGANLSYEFWACGRLTGTYP
jgi:hypothetical protein